MTRRFAPPWLGLLLVALLLPHPNIVHLDYFPVARLFYEGLAHGFDAELFLFALGLAAVYWLLLALVFYPVRWLLRRLRRPPFTPGN
jgi:hypothetical protein